MWKWVFKCATSNSQKKWSKTQNSFFAMDYFWLLYEEWESFWEFFSIWQLWIPKKSRLFFFYMVIFMSCEGVRDAFTLSLKAHSGSSLLTTVPWHSPAYTGVGCAAAVLFSARHRVCFCHLSGCNGRDEVPLISLVKHSRSTMFLIISYYGLERHSGDARLGLCVVFENDEWWSLPPCQLSQLRLRAPGLRMASWSLTVCLWVMVSHVEHSRF